VKQIHARIDLLSAEEIERIHAATREVLHDTGCHLPHKKVLNRLAGAGANVDFGMATVKLPSGLVEKAMTSLAGGRRISAEDRFSRGATGRMRIFPGNQALIIDCHAQGRRRGTLADVLNGTVLCNELSHIDRVMPLVTPADVPDCLADLYGYYLCVLYSKKPCSVYILSPESARRIIRIANVCGKHLL